MVHRRIMKINKNLPGDTPNNIPKFRGDVWFLNPSRTNRHKIHFIYVDLKFCTQACIIHSLVGTENGIYRSTRSGTSHISQIGILET